MYVSAYIMYVLYVLYVCMYVCISYLTMYVCNSLIYLLLFQWGFLAGIDRTYHQAGIQTFQHEKHTAYACLVRRPTLENSSYMHAYIHTYYRFFNALFKYHTFLSLKMHTTYTHTYIQYIYENLLIHTYIHTYRVHTSRAGVKEPPPGIPV